MAALFDQMSVDLAAMVADKVEFAADNGIWYSAQQREDALNSAIQQIARKAIADKDFDALVPYMKKSSQSITGAGDLVITFDDTFVGIYEATLDGRPLIVLRGMPRKDFIYSLRPYSHVAVHNDGGTYKAVSPDWSMNNSGTATLTVIWVSVPRYSRGGATDIPQCFHDQFRSSILMLAQQYLAQIEVQTV